MIRLENVNKFFNKGKKNEIHIINNTSLTLESNGLVALLGQSGSGKTTLLNAISGLDKVNSGKIYIDGKRITKKSSYEVDKIRNLNIGYIFQDYKLIDNLSVFDNIAIVLKMIGIKDKEEIKSRVEYVLNKLNMYRYRNRPASMLSGGERQRVGIARAIVKDPNIIIADEPTGNLDSKNSLEIMNIIKSISKEKLVILVTHENDLAKFYASRIIEIKDGKIQKDYINEEVGELDYNQENKIYLKDLKEQEKLESDSLNINYYSNEKNKIKLNIVVKNGNVYIKSENNKKIEILDDKSSIEIIDDHYKKIDKSIYQEYQFNFKDNINQNIKKKYSSILNPITLVLNGFKKVLDFPVLKKILLVGFLLSGIFTMYSISSICGALNIKDSDFISINKNYLVAKVINMKIDDYIKYEKFDDINYILPSDSKLSFTVKYDDYYQTSKQTDTLSGSLSSINMINEGELLYGKMPQNEYEVVVDKMSIQKMFDASYAKMAGITTIEQMVGRKIYLQNMKPFTISGITDLENPSIYANESMFINILSNAGKASSGEYMMFGTEETNTNATEGLLDYKLIESEIELKEGNWPINDYEVIVNIENKEQMPLGKEIDLTINEKKLKVVGYYYSKEDNKLQLVNNNTIKYNLIRNASSIAIYSKDSDKTISQFRDLEINLKDSYTNSKEEYIKEKRESVISTLTVTGIMLGISLIEIFLMVRSSFLSRIKEIGIYRAIGLKKVDVYKMFLGEIIAITTMASVPGIIFMAYILNILSTIKYLSSYFLINFGIVLASIIFIYLFNIIVGLIPVYNTVRKTPAEILSRHDI